MYFFFVAFPGNSLFGEALTPSAYGIGINLTPTSELFNGHPFSAAGGADDASRQSKVAVGSGQAAGLVLESRPGT